MSRNAALPITYIHTYLVHPSKGEAAPPPIKGSALPLTGAMFRILQEVYNRSDQECDVAISFNRDSTGAQRNDCRDLIVAYATAPTVDAGRTIAMRLAAHTDHRPRLGLLFLMVGQEGLEHKVIISRFPADSAISAEEDGEGLNVAFLERVFMKNAKSYKAVLYRHRSLATGFWEGSAIDKQMNDSDVKVSRYWINDFLDSDFRTTAEAGTRRLAVACRSAARKSNDTAVKSEIAAAVTLAAGQNGQRLSARGFADSLRLSEAARAAIFAEIKPHLLDESFQFSAEEFGRQVAYRSIELDNGGMLTAETAEFDRIFASEVINQAEGTVRYSTEGRIVREKLNKALR